MSSENCTPTALMSIYIVYNPTRLFDGPILERTEKNRIILK